MKTFYEWIPHCNYRISAKAIIRNEEWKFAMCLKQMMVHWKLQTKWDIPGWWIDHGEDVFTALRREILEEMWLTVTNIESSPKYFFLWESACWEKPLAQVCYEIELEDMSYTKTDECLEMKFFTLDEALQADTYSMVHKALLEVKENFWKY